MTTTGTTSSNTPTGRHDMNSQNTPETPTLVHLAETTGGPTAAEMLAGLPKDTTITAFDGAPVGSGRSQRPVTEVELPHEEIARLLAEAGQVEGRDYEDDEFTRGEALLIEARYAWANSQAPSGYRIDEAHDDPAQMNIGWVDTGHHDRAIETVDLRVQGEWLSRPAFEAEFQKQLAFLVEYIDDCIAEQAERDAEEAEGLKDRQDRQRTESEIQVVDLEHDPADGRWSWTLRSSDPEVDDEFCFTTSYPYEGDGVFRDGGVQVTGKDQFTLRDCVDRPEVAQLRVELFHRVVDAE